MTNPTRYFSLKGPSHWLWRSKFTLDEVVEKLRKLEIEEDWLICPLGEAEKAVSVRELVQNPEVFAPRLQDDDARTSSGAEGSEARAAEVKGLVFLGFNKRVVALRRSTGDKAWGWKAPSGSSYVSLLLLDESQLIVSVVGYTYCLDPLTGEQLWYNELSGLGTGVVSIVALDRRNPLDPVVASAAHDAASRSQAAGGSVG